jgi:hypothetical protein
MESAGISNRGEILSSSAVMRASWEAGDEAEADDGAVKAVVLEKCRRAIPSPLLILPFQLLLLTDGDSLKQEEMRLGIIDGTCLGSWKRRDWIALMCTSPCSSPSVPVSICRPLLPGWH